MKSTPAPAYRDGNGTLHALEVGTIQPAFLVFKDIAAPGFYFGIREADRTPAVFHVSQYVSHSAKKEVANG